MTPEEIGWLAGILDGEGYVSMQLTRSHGARLKRHGYIPTIGLANSDFSILGKASKILTEIGCTVLSSELTKHNKLARKRCFQIRIRDQQSLLKLLRATLPHMVRLRARGEKLEQWLILRSLREGYKARYSEEEKVLADEIRLAPSGDTEVLAARRD